METTEELIQEISIEQFGEWKQHPVTKAVFFKMQQQINDIQTIINNGNTLEGDAVKIVRETSRWLGIIEALTAMLNFQWEE